jgi:hypothetical protein
MSKMIQNINAKPLACFLSLIFSFALNAQQIDTLNNTGNVVNSDTSKRWARISYGINGGYFWGKSNSTGLVVGDYSLFTSSMIGLTLKLNLGKKLSIGTAFNWYYIGSVSSSPVTITTEAPSTIATEPTYSLVHQGTVGGGYSVFDIPLEVTYKFNTIKKHIIPIVSLGTTFFINPPSISINFPSEYLPYAIRTSGSRPVENEILRPNSSFDFTNKNQTAPFCTAGFIWAFSDHTCVKLQAKYALNQNTATSVLSSKSESITLSSKLYTQQMGVVAEYFITF